MVLGMQKKQRKALDMLVTIETIKTNKMFSVPPLLFDKELKLIAVKTSRRNLIDISKDLQKVISWLAGQNIKHSECFEMQKLYRVQLEKSDHVVNTDVKFIGITLDKEEHVLLAKLSIG